MIGVRPFQPADLQWLALQSAQRLWLGLHTPALDAAYGEQLAAAGPAFTVTTPAGWVIAAAGFHEIFPTYAVAWSLLAEGVGQWQLPLTRAVAARLEASPYNRIEALVRTDYPPAARWARMLGFHCGALVARAGPEDEDYFMFERVRPRHAAQRLAA